MKQFNEDFKNKLYQTISDIEDNSLVEVVTIIRQQSAKYKDVGLLVAAIFTGIVLIFIMFVPIVIEEYDALIFVFTFLSFLFAFFLTMNVPGLLKLFIKQKRIDKNVEIMARAIFQKGGIRFTDKKIGVLFFISYFEQKVVIVADRGAQLSVPQEDWDSIQAQFDTCFKEGSVSENILKVLSNTKDIFNSYIPPVENDINELPDNLEVDF